ncbi:MAG: 7-cyano-7-deazaguanine synthase [Thaumarchaeota archaeon]|nr:7-cyano-7-deazaguanine synthase [Nitrososphaerota archaeon]
MKAVIVFSGGLDSVCTAAHMKKKYQLYGITFSYGQKADNEVKIARKFSELLEFKEHKVVDISFMKELYGNTNALTDSKITIPSEFDYSIVAPIRNAIFLSIASAWAFAKEAEIVAYGAHTGDMKYPDCRPTFAKLLTKALNQGEIDGINLNLRKKIRIWSPFMDNLSKSDLLKKGYKELGQNIFKSWSCYCGNKIHCGICESCNNRKLAFHKSKIVDKTKYLKI